MADKAEYPKWVYKGDKSALVKDAEEHAALGKGWSESPAPAAPVKESKKAED